MAKSLVIVESPAKARTLGKYLGKDFNVLASVGHIKDLPQNALGVEIENGFKPKYSIIPGKKDVVDRIRKAAKSAQTIYLAADPDREGEAIAWHLKDEIAKVKENKDKEYLRVLVTEITSRGVKEAFDSPRSFNDKERRDLFDAQQARRILDRLVGYKISPLLWVKVKRGLSAGRVQSVAVRFIVERERLARAFKPEEYWTLTARLEGSLPPSFEAKLAKIDGKRAKVKNGDEANEIRDALLKGSFVLSNVTRKTKLRSPVPPFITSKLQQEASRKLRFSAKYTMGLAQKLYEGVDLGDEGPVGLITYMRTDSVRVSEAALAEVRSYITEKFGKEYAPETPNYYKNRKNIQDAHEAIRPTSVMRSPESVRQYFKAGEEDAFKLYELIWKRFIASQMTPAVFDQTLFEIENGRYTLTAAGEIMKFNGFIAVYEEGRDEAQPEPNSDDNGAGEPEGETQSGLLPNLEKGETLRPLDMAATQKFTEPPPRYSEATLVRELEEKGIGRPSTYAAILSNIQDRGYVEKKQGKFYPTELGELITDLLVASFSKIIDEKFTAEMENKLDQVEEGGEDWKKLLEDFYSAFESQLSIAQEQMSKVKGTVAEDAKCPVCQADMIIRWGKRGAFLACSKYPECQGSMDFTRDDSGKIVPIEKKEPKSVGVCPTCGAQMVLRNGRFGKFAACVRYPECKTTAQLKNLNKEENAPAEENVAAANGEGEDKKDKTPKQKVGECPKCKSDLVIRKGRFGRFISCSNYPKCDYKAPLSIKVPCPKRCGGQIVEKRTRHGKIFYGCSNYPNCDYSTWKRPVERVCPSCGAPSMVEYYSKEGAVFKCELCQAEDRETRA